MRPFVRESGHHRVTWLHSVDNVKHSYNQILRASALIGGASAMNIAIGMVRTKAMAILLGPSGVGLLGIYASIVDLARGIVGMGLNSSGVRQIAEAVGSADTQRIARTATVLRRTSILLGLAGLLLLIILARPLSIFTFGNAEHGLAVGCLSIAVFLYTICDAQGALIQGMRRVADLAKMGVVGALLGTLVSVPMVFYLGDVALVPALICVAAMTLLLSWWYSSKLGIQSAPMTAAEVNSERAALLKLGLVFMSSGLMTIGSAYAVRMLVLRQSGLEAAGLYQAAFTLGGLYVGFILQAMGTDFYPRLAAVVRDDARCVRVVNEQAYVSLLIAGPGVIATLTFASLVITLFYSTQFEGAVPALRWICFGMALRVISWPMGYIIVAAGNRALFFWSEFAWTIVHLSLAWSCVRYFGLVGAGVAFFGSYVFHCCLIYVLVRRLNGFRWSAENLRTSALFLSLIAISFGASYLFSPLPATLIGSIAMLVCCAYSLRALLSFASLHRVPRGILRLLACVGLPVPKSESEASPFRGN